MVSQRLDYKVRSIVQRDPLKRAPVIHALAKNIIRAFPMVASRGKSEERKRGEAGGRSPIADLEGDMTTHIGRNQRREKGEAGGEIKGERKG